MAGRETITLVMARDELSAWVGSSLAANISHVQSLYAGKVELWLSVTSALRLSKSRETAEHDRVGRRPIGLRESVSIDEPRRN
jgi:hypothetical protein